MSMRDHRARAAVELWRESLSEREGPPARLMKLEPRRKVPHGGGSGMLEAVVNLILTLAGAAVFLVVVGALLKVGWRML